MASSKRQHSSTDEESDRPGSDSLRQCESTRSICSEDKEDVEAKGNMEAVNYPVQLPVRYRSENFRKWSTRKAELVPRNDVYTQLDKLGHIKENKKCIWGVSPAKHKSHKRVIIMSA